jgi:hypothetical protein
VVEVDGEDVHVDSGDGGDTDEELAALRHEWEGEFVDFVGFYVMIRGGKWTKRVKKKAADCIRAKAISIEVKTWCDDYHWPKEKSYAFKKYTLEGASVLANEFARVANHYYAIWLGQDDSKYVFTPEDKVADDVGFLNWMTALDADSVHFARGFELVSLWPL